MPDLMTHALSTIKAQPIQWLWPGRVARGKLTLIAGDPGLGKSFITMDLCARVSAGLAMPDGPSPLRAPGSCLVLSAEDDAGDTIRPRIEAADGDVSRVHVVEGVARDEARCLMPVSLDQDCLALSVCLSKMDRPRLVIIDPVSAYMGEADSHNNAQVRAVLAALSRVAQRHDVAVVAVTHLNKSSTASPAKAVYRAMGSLAFTAAARAVWQVAKHPDDADLRTLLLVKSNLPRPAPGEAGHSGLRFRLKNGRVSWEGVEEALTADGVDDPAQAEEQRGTGEAVRFLRELLASGPMPATEVLREAQGACIAERSLRRARSSLGVVSRKARGAGPQGGVGAWVWSLPGASGSDGADGGEGCAS